ncbi:MAG TPA: NAD(P)-dependent oxidoreductase [Gammaproteobacteria bacterium]|nr:NAD(P)-dependent oxidoreductase [Gammaproteobacteria bacterium]
MKTGLIGLGAMGSAMARNLQRAGHLARIWARRDERAQTLVTDLAEEVDGAHPAIAASDPAALAAECEVVITSVSSDPAFLEVVEAMLPGLTPGTVVIDTSTVSAATARAVGARLAELEVEFLDAPVSGGVEGAQQAQLVAMVGGDEETLALVYPVLQVIAARIVHMGPVGAGQATKAVNQVMVAGINQAVAEGLAFAEVMELPMDKVIEVLGSGAAASWQLDHRGRAMTAGKFDPGFRVALHHKDLAIAQAMAAERGARLPLVEMSLLHYRRLMDEGRGDEDISALFRIKQQLFTEQS